MADKFNCDGCGKSYRWKKELAGRKVRCKCGHVMRVPQTLAAAEDSYELDFGDMAALDDGAQAAAPVATAPAPGGSGACPGCGQALSAGAVICVGCGYNLKTGNAMQTSVGRAVKQSGGGGARRASYDGVLDGWGGRFSRSWEFAKISYGILWDFKQLVIFPFLSGIALVLVVLSFILPLWNTGTMEQFSAFVDEETPITNVNPIVYVLVFAFYFCNFFVIVFFNTALAACALKVCAGETPTIGYGLSIAVKRLPQIIGWALLSAVVGLILKIIENIHEKAGVIIAAIIGTAWSALTYFVVPVLAVEGVGPFKALKESVRTLKDTWGEAVLGNFSMGLLTFIVTLPLYLIFGAVLFLGISGGTELLIGAGIAGLIIVVLVSAVVSSAADIVFRSLLYNYATGRTIPAEIDEGVFEAAFAGKA